MIVGAGGSEGVASVDTKDELASGDTAPPLLSLFLSLSLLLSSRIAVSEASVDGSVVPAAPPPAPLLNPKPFGV